MTRKPLRIALAVIALLALMCAPALAEVVSPGYDFYYLDTENVLSEELKGEIYYSNVLLSMICGAQFVVVTIGTTDDIPIEDYAITLFNDWGIGDAIENNGFLLLLAIADDDYYALPGTGLSKLFSSTEISDYLFTYLEDGFANKDYNAGVKAFFEATFNHISMLYGAGLTAEQGIRAYERHLA